MTQKKNTRKKEVLNSDAGDEPCTCEHPRRSHLGPDANMCLGCYADIKSNWFHPFKLDNLSYIEKLYSQQEFDEFKQALEKLKHENT